jgi:hypothetical protein
VDPVWNQHYVFKEPYPGDSLHFIVKNRGVLSGDEDIGKFVLLYEHFYPNGFYGTLQLEDTRKGVSALLTVRVSVKKAGDAKWCHPLSMAGTQLAKSARIKMQSSNGKSTRSPAAKQKTKTSKSHHGHAREFSEYGQTYAQSISDLKAFAEARRHSAPKLARTRSDSQIISSQAKIHIPTAMAQNMQDGAIPIDIAHDIQEMQEAEQFRQEVCLRKGEEMQRKANAVSETERQSQTKVLQQAPGQEIRQSHISSDSDAEAAAQYSPDLLKAMHAWYLQAGGSSASSASKVEDKDENGGHDLPSLDIVHEYISEMTANSQQPLMKPVCSTLIEEQDKLVIEESGFEIVTGQFAGQIGIRFLRASGEITQVYGGAPANIFGVEKGWYILCLDGVPYSRELFHQMIASQEQYHITFFVPPGHRHHRRSIVRGTPVAGEPHDPDVALVDGTRVEDVPGTVVVMGTPIEGATHVVAGTVAASEDFRDLAHQHHSSYSKAHTDSQAPHPSVPSCLADLHPDAQQD